MPSKKYTKTQCPPSLGQHNVLLKTFVSKNGQYNNFKVASFIFFRPRDDVDVFQYAYMMNPAKKPSNIPIEPVRLLILQRSHLKYGFPELWEVPETGSEPMDPTILHAVTRSTLEKTGLHLKKFVGLVGDGETINGTDELKSLKLSFEIEVKELAGLGKLGLDHLQVKLDPEEHQEFYWATEQDINDDIFPAVTPEAKALILRAFEQQGSHEQRMVASAGSSSKARQEDEGEDDGDDDAEGDEEEGDEEN